jgi:4-hydroxy-2-oxovalerate aldolase
MFKTKPSILETTLRDGSYAINFTFTASDTAIIAKELEDAGFELIEIGHGVGLGASRKGKGEAAETDEGYLKAAADTLTTSRFGMFCIPGIASLDDVDMAADYGMGFIRVGTNVTETEQGEPFIARAKKHGMLVSTNFMKSYAMAPRDFAQKAKLAQQYGADMLCVVDSAGGMLRQELEDYFAAVREVCDIPLAFHGHDNLGLAVANSLRAVELGAVVVDSSLQGLGRSAGNAPTELIIAALNRMGFDLGFDLVHILDLGEKYIKPLVKRRGLRSLDVVAGYSQFHSSYMGVIRKYSSRHRVCPRRLIINLCEQDKVNAPEDLVERLACELEGTTDEVFTARYDFDKYFGDEQS